MGGIWSASTAMGTLRSSRVRRGLAAVAIGLSASVVVLASSPGKAWAATPTAGYGEGSGFCSSAVPGGSTLGASYDNVYACGPANNNGTGYEVPAGGSYQGFFEDSDYEFQCVELANRFVFDVWNLQPISGGSLDGADYASTLSSERGVTLVANGTAGQPYLPGDVVSFTGSGALADGHVAVVMSSTYSAGDGGNYSVTLLQEDASANGEASATVTDWSMGDPSGSEVTPSNFDALASGGGSGPPSTGTDLVENGGFNAGTADWEVGSGTNFAVYVNGQVTGTNAYEGNSFGAANAPSAEASVYEDIPMTINSGETYCASAEMVTAGETSGGGASLVIWLIGDSSNENSSYVFSNLPGGNSWTPGSTCVTATGPHTDLRSSRSIPTTTARPSPSTRSMRTLILLRMADSMPALRTGKSAAALTSPSTSTARLPGPMPTRGTPLVPPMRPARRPRSMRTSR